MATYVITNQKGGVGKTTLSCLLAWWLREHGSTELLLVDLDSQGNLSRTFEPHATGTLAQAFFQTAIPDIQHHPSGITLAGEPGKLQKLKTGDEQSPRLFQRAIGEVKGNFTDIVIDTPPAFGWRMIAALLVADYVACPIELEDYSIDGVTAMLKTIFAMRQLHNPKLTFLGMVANRFNPHSAAQKQALHQLLSEYSEYM